MVRLEELHQTKGPNTAWRLDRAFQQYQCWDFLNWRIGAAGCPKTDPTPEAEPAVLAAIVSALTPCPDYYPQFPDGRREEFPQDQRQELEALRGQALRLARSRQTALDGNRPPADGTAAPFLEFPTKERRLLMALWSQGEVPTEAVLRAIWEDEPPRQPEDALHKLKTRTNKRLTVKNYNLEIRQEGKTYKLCSV